MIILKCVLSVIGIILVLCVIMKGAEIIANIDITGEN